MASAHTRTKKPKDSIELSLPKRLWQALDRLAEARSESPDKIIGGIVREHLAKNRGN